VLDVISTTILAEFALNVNVKFNFFDSNETKNSSNVVSISNKINLSDVIIGPFYQNNAEETAKLLPNIPVISPLSKENTNAIKNLYQSMPSSDYVKIKTFDYLAQKNGLSIIIEIIKKSSEYLNKKGIIFLEFDPRQKQKIIKLCKKQKIKYFIKKDLQNRDRILILKK
jgi:hypothetical protein